MGGREMKNEQINIAISEARGIVGPFENRWIKEVEMEGGLTGYESYGLTGFVKDELVFVADYCNDLNAMHEAERTSTIFKSWRATKAWMDNLCICSDLGRLPESAPDWAFVLQASAAQRAEAFLKTIGEWEE